MKVLTLDIETSPHEGYSFQVWQTNIAPNQMIQPTCILSFAAKWKGDKQSEIIYRTCFDEDMHETLHRLLDEADLIVTYNGDKFDLRHIKREFVERGFFPPRPAPSVDLLKVVKKHFAFPHNRLDYVAQRLLGETKLETGGFELWPAFMRQEPQALKLMQRYNKKDTVLTEKLYLKLMPWIMNHPYVGGGGVVIEDGEIIYTCPACESTRIRRDHRRTRCFAIRSNQCKSCGTWFDGKRKKIS